MLHTTLRDIKQHDAHDITNLSFDAINALRKKGLQAVAISRGVYGINGALFTDPDGNTYKITARSSALFQLI